MDDLINEFIAETVESLSELDSDLVKLEQDPENAELLGNIFRLMHTIKGTCGFLSLPRLEKTAHAGENLLDLFRNGEMEVSQTAMTLVFLCIDRVRYLTFEIEKTGAEPDGDDQDIISQIEEEISKNEKSKSTEDEKLHTIVEEEEISPPKIKEEKTDNDIQPYAESPPAKKPVVQNIEKSKPPEFLRVQMSVLEGLINMVSELVLTRNQLLQIIPAEEDSNASAPLQRLNRIVSDLQEGVTKTRMQPISNAWAKLPRIVRDLSIELDKKITLEMSGEETELDRQVLEMIKDPLTHMVRNSCDHGIEIPEDRQKLKKPETGIITLKAYHEGGFIIVEISDDGKGLDAEKIGKKCVEKGLIDEERLSAMSNKQILQHVFKPGFSMAENVTNVSGRGVGMDVVRTNIEKIGGTIDMDSALGKGTTFKIQIPLTLAIISALIVEINGLRYAVPQLNIQELVRIHPNDSERIEVINDRPVFRLRDHILPLIDSETLFDGFIPNDKIVEDSLKEKRAELETGNKLIAVISAGSSSFGLVVDAVHDMEEIVIKSISSVLQDTKIFSGNTILGDGDVIMILDPASIARRFDVGTEIRNANAEKIESEEEEKAKLSEKIAMLVFKAGNETPFSIPLALISRLQQMDIKDVSESGDEIVAKYNGELLPLYFICEDGQKLESDIVTTLILSDDVSEAAIGLIIENVVDIVEDKLDLTTSTARPGVIGSVTLNEMIVDVVDIAHYLGKTQEDFFSVSEHQQTPYITDTNNSEPNVHSNKSRVLVVDDSPFFRNMLKPILISFGYDVTVSEDAIAALELHDKGHMFDIILSDIEMPNMNGYEFIEKIRKDSSWKNLPCIAITSHTTNEDIEYGYEKGFDKYIGKFDKNELSRAMTSVLSDKGSV